MLVRDSKPTNLSPFHFKGTECKSTTEQPQIQLPVENNRERTFRRAANACEVASGVCLNSTIIFTFHLLQVHPIGVLLAVGTCHFYFTATALGEKSLPTALVGGACSFSVLCALHEPLGEWFEAKTSVNRAVVEIERIYSPDQRFEMPVGMVLALVIVVIKFVGVRAISKK